LYFTKDVLEFLYLLDKHNVNYLIVGGEAVILYGFSRLTGDIDIFYERTKENVDKLYKVLLDFWNNDIPGIKSNKDLLKKRVIFQFGVPPNRIDLINSIDGVSFSKAWKNRFIYSIPYKKRKINIYYIGLNDLIRNKKASNRYKDKEDLKFLIKVKEKIEKNQK